MNITVQFHLDVKIDAGSSVPVIDGQLAKVQALVEQASNFLAAFSSGQNTPSAVDTEVKAQQPRVARKKKIQGGTADLVSPVMSQEALVTVGRAEPEINPLVDLSSPALYTNGSGHDETTGSTSVTEVSSNRLSFEQLDKLVRIEMKRLAMDGRMPSHKLWDSQRKPPLPTLAALILRYKASGVADLARRLDMRPPLSAQSSEADMFVKKNLALNHA